MLNKAEISRRSFLSYKTFGAPLDFSLRWAYRYGGFVYNHGNFSSLCMVPVTERCKRFAPIIPYDFCSPSSTAYLIHFMSSYPRRNLRLSIAETLEIALSQFDYIFPLTVVTYIQTEMGARMLRSFYGMRVRPKDWVRRCFLSIDSLLKPFS